MATTHDGKKVVLHHDRTWTSTWNDSVSIDKNFQGDALTNSKSKKVFLKKDGTWVNAVYLIDQYLNLKDHSTLGNYNTDKAIILSGPKTFKMPIVSGRDYTNAKEDRNGKIWDIQLGDHKFKVSIAKNATLVNIENVLEMLEKIPPIYRRAFEIVSEDGKAGVAFFKNLGGAGGHGGQSYINLLQGVNENTVIHEIGHCLEQRARNMDEEILDKWYNAIQLDENAISMYGNTGGHWEELADYAIVYAIALNSCVTNTVDNSHGEPKPAFPKIYGEGNVVAFHEYHQVSGYSDNFFGITDDDYQKIKKGLVKGTRISIHSNVKNKTTVLKFDHVTGVLENSGIRYMYLQKTTDSYRIIHNNLYIPLMVGDTWYLNKHLKGLDLAKINKIADEKPVYIQPDIDYIRACPDHLGKLKLKSPRRYKLWEQILELSGAY